jgi:O-acetyl-ADP-ribose deacetylase (regulator of RNase III)
MDARGVQHCTPGDASWSVVLKGRRTVMVKYVLVDINAQMVRAWQEVFGESEHVQIVQGSILTQPVSAWVSPGNSLARMDGGLDAVIRRHLGGRVQARLRREVSQRFSGSMPIGTAACVETGRTQPAYLISTPTMNQSAEDISETYNVAYSCVAALWAVQAQNERAPGSIRSVALPGLGTGTGRVSVDVCAELMFAAFEVIRDSNATDFAELALQMSDYLGDSQGVAWARTNKVRTPLALSA